MSQPGARRSSGRKGESYQPYEPLAAHAFAPVPVRHPMSGPGYAAGDSAAAGMGAPDYAQRSHPNPGAAKGASAAHGGSSRWGFLHPEGAVASPRFAGLGGMSAGWMGESVRQGGGPEAPLGGLSSRFHGQSGIQSGPMDQSGTVLPVELPSQQIAGGHTTRDLGQGFSKTGGQEDGGTAEGVTRPFTEEVVSYKHGDNVILHQWAGGGDLLVNCQSPTPQSFICQYGISSGSMAWTLDVSRTCDKFWFGVTVDKDLDCNDWIADHDAAYMISEEGEIEEKTYENYVPKTARERPARPAMVQQADAAPRWVRLKPFPPAANIQGIWASVAFVLDMDKRELYMQVRNGSGDTSPKSRLFRGLPNGFKVYPCLSMCNAGQVVFLKYGE